MNFMTFSPFARLAVEGEGMGTGVSIVAIVKGCASSGKSGETAGMVTYAFCAGVHPTALVDGKVTVSRMESEDRISTRAVCSVARDCQYFK